MKFVVQNPDNTEDNYEIVSGAPGDMLADETICAVVCRIWRQLIEKENEYRAPVGIKYEHQYVLDAPIIDAIKKSKEKVYLVKKGNDIIGMACTSNTSFENIYNISDVVVLEEFRGKGIGKVLLEHILEDNVPKVPILGVELENKHAVDLYRSMGFVEYSMKMVLAPKAE